MSDSGFLSTQTALNKKVYYQTFLEREKESLAIHELAQKRRVGISPNKGDNIEFTQYLPQALVTSALSEGTPPSDSDFTTQVKTASLDEWGDFTKYSSRFEFATFDPRMKELSGVKGQQAGESIELQTVKTLATTGVVGMRADGDTNYEKHNLSVTTATSTTAFKCSTLAAGSDDDWVGAIITITAGPGYGEARICTSSTASDGTLEVGTAFNTAPTTSSKFSICHDTSLAATDILTADVFRRAIRQLRRNNFMPFPGGWAACVVSPNTEFDFMDDTDLKNLFISHVSGNKGLFKNEIGQVWGAKVTRATMPYAYTIGAPETYVSGGTGEDVIFIGANALGVVEAEGRGLKMIYSKPEIAEPKLHMYGYMGWKAMWVCKPLNACWAVGMKCGYTA